MNILETAEKYEDYILTVRHRLHEEPELSGEEYETSQFVREELDKIGVPYITCGLGLGILATIAGKEGGKTILLRGDMDAIAVNEENDLPFKSKRPNVMHACGHDTHTASLLTAAHILNEIKDELPGTVKLAFQPAEENSLGANAMILEGAMEGVDAVYAQHVWGGVPSGYVAAPAGPRMAASSEFIITLRGRGGHGAEPSECVDPIPCAATIVSSLQTLVSREFSPFDPIVCTVGSIHFGTQYNIIADSGTICGTARCYSEEVYEELPIRMERILQGIGDAYRCEVELEYHRLLTRAVINHPVMADIVQGSVRTIFGEGSHYNYRAVGGSEDFSSFIAAAPDKMGTMAFIGISSEACDSYYPNHNPKFKVDEAQLLKAACLYSQVAVDYLGRGIGENV